MLYNTSCIMKTIILAFLVIAEISIGLCKFTITVPDETSLTRPCPGLDPCCIRDLFAKSGWCDKQLQRPSSDVLCIGDVPFNSPYLNLSGKQKNASVTGLKDGWVEDFYYNNHTGNSVMTLFVPELRVSASCEAHLQRKGKEDLVFTIDRTYDYCPMMEATTIFSKKGRKSHATCESFAYTLGDKLEEIDDKDVLKVLHTMAKYESVIVAESILERVQTLVDLCIEYYICGYQD